MEHKKDLVELKFEDPDALVKHILNTVKDKCKTEAVRKELVVPFSDRHARVEYYTGISNSLINKLLADKPRISMLDLDSRILILESVKTIYSQNRTPIYQTIYEEAIKHGQLHTTDDNIITDIYKFIKEMEILGYQWKETIQNTKIIMEDPEIRFERYIYLNKLRKFRNNNTQWQIVYVDERLINDGQAFQKPWLADPPPAKSPGLEESTFYHAVSKTGYIDGMFSNQASEADFTKWLTDILLMQLKSPSVIIMDNNPLHGTLENVSSITRYHSKMDMLRWLTNNNIPCSSNMSKPSLYELIKKCNEDHKEYKIDCIIRSQGHEVLRLPQHLYDMSITTPLWEIIVTNGIGQTKTLVHLQSQLTKIIYSISASNWAEYEEYVEKKEKEILNIDMALEKFCDKYDLKLDK